MKILNPQIFEVPTSLGSLRAALQNWENDSLQQYITFLNTWKFVKKNVTFKKHMCKNNH